MEERLKQRLVGGAVLVSLVVIFVPMLMEERVVTERAFSETKIPEKPKIFQQQQESHAILPDPIARVDPVKPVEPVEPVEEAEPIPESVESSPPEEVQRFGKIERPTPSAWMVQVASFSKQQNAQKLVDKLNKAGMPAQVKEVRINSKLHYRVQMLPQLDKNQAEEVVNTIKKKFGLKASVVRYAG